MRVALVNYVWDAAAATPPATLDRFETLTGWADALHAANARVSVFQRFHVDDAIVRNGVTYAFCADGHSPRPWTGARRASRLHRAIVAFAPDVVHVNGFEYPLLIRSVRRAVAWPTALVVQDHGGLEIERLSRFRQRWLKHGLAAADAFLAASPGQIANAAGMSLLPASVTGYDVMESSTRFEPVPYTRARARCGMTGDPAVLWVGRLNANKDPLTVLHGFERFARDCPNAQLSLVYRSGSAGRDNLEDKVRDTIDATPLLAARVRLVGEVPHAALAAYYSAADLFVLGSHTEGSGYAVLEALACGATPVVTAIPSFRVLTDEGRVGAIWRVGDSQSLCDALGRAAVLGREEARRAARMLFEDRFSWSAIGARAVRIYEDVLARRRGGPLQGAIGPAPPGPARLRSHR